MRFNSGFKGLIWAYTEMCDFYGYTQKMGKTSVFSFYLYYRIPPLEFSALATYVGDTGFRFEEGDRLP